MMKLYCLKLHLLVIQNLLYIFTNSYVQCVFDNADHNSQIYDSRNTLHERNFTILVQTSESIKRLKKAQIAFFKKWIQANI